MTLKEANRVLIDMIERGVEYDDGYGLTALTDLQIEAINIAIKAVAESEE